MRGFSAGFAGDQSGAMAAGNFSSTSRILPRRPVDAVSRGPHKSTSASSTWTGSKCWKPCRGSLFGGGAEAGRGALHNQQASSSACSRASAEASYGFYQRRRAQHQCQRHPQHPGGFRQIRRAPWWIYDEASGGYIDNVPSTFTYANSDLGNHYLNTLPTAGVCPNGMPPGTAGSCTLANAPQANTFAIAHPDQQNLVTYTGARLSALHKINDDWSILIAESVQNLDAEGLLGRVPDRLRISRFFTSSVHGDRVRRRPTDKRQFREHCSGPSTARSAI